MSADISIVNSRGLKTKRKRDIFKRTHVLKNNIEIWLYINKNNIKYGFLYTIRKISSKYDAFDLICTYISLKNIRKTTFIKLEHRKMKK